MLSQFLAKQFIDVIQWNEPEDGVLSYRFPMQDMEIQNGGQLTVRESQMAAFINEGRIADVFGPGLYTLTTRNLPLLTDLMNWDKAFESPFKSDVYFFSTRQQIDQKWGTASPSRCAIRSSARSACAPSATTPTASPILASFLTRWPVRAMPSSPAISTASSAPPSWPA